MSNHYLPLPPRRYHPHAILDSTYTGHQRQSGAVGKICKVGTGNGKNAKMLGALREAEELVLLLVVCVLCL